MNRIENVYGLTPVQEGIYAQYFQNKATDAYHLYYLFSLGEDTDLAVLRQALELLPLRHPVLKTAFAVAEGNVKQVILADRKPTVKHLFFNCAYTREALENAVQEEKALPLDLRRDPLVRCTFLVFSDARFLFFHTHHLIVDGWCTTVLFEDLSAFYRALADGEPADALKVRAEAEQKAETSFADHVNLVRRRDTSEARAYWQKLLAYWTPSPLPRRTSPADTDEFERINLTSPPETSRRAHIFAHERALPLNTLLESAFALALQKHTGTNDVVFHKVVSGRSFGLVKTERTVGPMINTVPVRAKRIDSTTPQQFLEAINEQAVNANEYGFLPLSDVLRTSGIDPNAVDVLLDYGNYALPETDGTQSIRLLELRERTEFPLTCIISPEEDSFRLQAIYNNHTLSAFFVHSLLNSFLFILDRISFMSGPALDNAAAFTKLFCLTPAEHGLLFGRSDNAETNKGFCTGPTVAVPEKSVYDLFSAQANKTGQTAYIKDNAASFSFPQLDSDAALIDTHIRSIAGTRKQIVGILCDRCYTRLAAIFGTVRGGNAYLPISPHFPPERIRSILEASGCSLVLAQKKYLHLTEKAYDAEALLQTAPPLPVPPPAAKPEDTLYVIFTSGSTGTPKGAMVSNRSAINRIQWMANRFFDKSSVVMMKTPFTFDVSVWEIFGFAMFGFSLYILPPEEHYRQSSVLEHIERGRVTDLHFVPTVFEQFLAVLENEKDPGNKLCSLRHIFLSGESLYAQTVNTFRRFHDGHIEIHNLYGPAECTVDVAAYACRETETDPIPIGRPVDNTQLYIVDPDLQPVPVGVTGELCVAGENVGQGYINDAGRTAAAFVRNPFGKGPLYKTGDLACWREDGSIIFMGRNDYQIKLNGQRIEPGEIEAALIAVEDVENAAVIPREDTAGNRILCAFYTGQKKKPDELHGILSRTLPTYMVPQVYTHLDAMPRTTSGKTDRAALVYTEITRIEDGSTYAPPETDAEKAICAAFSAVLKQKEVGRNADFFRLGGTSLQLISLLSRSPLEKITPSDFFKDPTPAGLAKRLDEAENTVYTYLMPLYIPSDPKKAIVLFPFAGGDAAAFTALVGKAREMGSSVSLYCVNWPEEAAFEAIAEEIRKLANREIVIFYSHCAGAAVALRFLDLLNNGNRLIKGYIAGAAIPPRKALAGFNTWAHMSDKTIEKILVRAGLPISPDNADVLHEKLDGFRRHTQAFSAYFQHKETITNTTVTIILSKADPIIPNYTDAEARWQKAVTDVDRVILIDTPSHYFQNTDTKLLLSLFSNLPD